ncbi:MAG TPA: dienelactone hydrolase family protein [Polyangiaceae bacterium]|nr:dienelactone hydrolase family protein [Polyangiaceae bacterium]
MRFRDFRPQLLVLIAILCVSGCKRASSASPGDAGNSPMRGAQAAPARSVAGSEGPAPVQPASRLEPELRQAGELAYLELLTGGAREEQELPLIVAIHGLGDRPERFVGFVNAFDVPARIVLPRGISEYGDGYSWFWFGDGRDIPRIARGVETATQKLAQAIVTITRERRTRGKPIVTGFSQGGILSFSLAVLHPELVSAVYPLAGVLPPQLIAKISDAGSFPPIVAFHGEADPVIRLADTRRSVETLKKRGLNVQLKTYPGVQHTPSFEMGLELFQELRSACQRTAQ